MSVDQISDGTTPSLAYRIDRYIKKYGVRSLPPRALDAVRKLLVLDETHVWYELPVSADRPRRELDEEFRFARADDSSVNLIEQLPTISLAEAKRRMDDGNDLWFALSGDRPAFACWTFRETMPVLSAPGGVMRIPAGTVCLEDSVTGPGFRGRGLAPAAWTLLADKMQRQGVGSIITKIGEDNEASRKAIVKAGFAEVGTMRFRRVMGIRRSRMTDAVGSAGQSLQAQFN